MCVKNVCVGGWGGGGNGSWNPRIEIHPTAKTRMQLLPLANAFNIVTKIFTRLPVTRRVTPAKSAERATTDNTAGVAVDRSNLNKVSVYTKNTVLLDWVRCPLPTLSAGFRASMTSPHWPMVSSSILRWKVKQDTRNFHILSHYWHFIASHFPPNITSFKLVGPQNLVLRG